LITGKNILSLNEKIQDVQNQLKNWFCKSCLIIITEKSKVLFLGETDLFQVPDSHFCINNKEVVCSVDVKFLGICITDDLSWATHTLYVSQTVSRNVYLAKLKSVLKYDIIF
jgi:hypothetical protein